MLKSKIEWTDATWSPIRARVKDNAAEIAVAHGWKDLAEICEKMKGHVGPHCEFVSPGCHRCYSCTNNHRRLPHNGTGAILDIRDRAKSVELHFVYPVRMIKRFGLAREAHRLKLRKHWFGEYQKKHFDLLLAIR